LLIDRDARSEGRALRLFTILLLILPIIFLTYLLFPIFGIFLRIGNHEYLAPLMNPKITSSILLSLQRATTHRTCFITVLVLGNRHRKEEKYTRRIDLGAHYNDD
jgi:ABC-type sulfate transport system permease component